MTNRQVTDTTDFYAIGNGDEILIDEKRFKVTGHARENRFGLEDPKFWVKRVMDVDSGERKIIKLEHLEAFDTTISGVKVKCFRSPEKEGDILNFVKDDFQFMQGTAHTDSNGNTLRVLDIVRGASFLSYIDSFKMPYERYLKTILPGVLKKVIRAFDAIRYLHQNDFKHGDIRNDHLIVDRSSGNYVWIDFDYDYISDDNPFSLDIFGLGNILAYAVGKGFHDRYHITNEKKTYGDLLKRLEPDDFSLLDQCRLMNLRKLYPIIPETLNNILMHFSRGTDVYYEAVDEIVKDLNLCLQAFYE